ncbi:MAG: NAD-dependent epimerase/dehydratase family protein [Chthoniobacteraceae bacterium]
MQKISCGNQPLSEIGISHPNLGDARPEKKTKRVMVTGASGYLGRSMCEELGKVYDLVRMDISETKGEGRFICGSVTDRQTLDDACDSVDVMVLAHMAPNRSDAYNWPDICMDINVKGVALALEAAVRHGIKRVVLISSVSVMWGHVQNRIFLTSELPPYPTDLYGMTKTLQEQIARFYSKNRGVEIAVLRPAYILREDSLVNKYGENMHTVTWQCIDPRDIGQAVIGAIETPELEFEIFYMIAGPGAEQRVDIDSAKKRLGWNPKYRFEGLAIEEI